MTSAFQVMSKRWRPNTLQPVKITDSVEQNEEVVKVVTEIVTIDRKLSNYSFHKVFFIYEFKLCGQAGEKKRRMIAK